MLRRVVEPLRPRERISSVEWAERYREMPEGSPIEGRFRFRTTPYLIEPLNAIDDPRVSRVVYRKSAQIGWTEGVVLNAIGKRIHVDPSRMLVLFPREKTGIDFNDEKFEPMIESVPALAERVNLKSRAAGNRQLFKKFPGGFVKFIASNSPGEVKSTSAPIVFVEEPDDCNQNIKGQGDAIKLAEERKKAYTNGKIVEGGTPTVEGVSTIDAEYDAGTQELYHVPCHECDEAAPLEWDQVRWQKDADHPDPVFGKHRPDTARYACPHCGALWDDTQKNRNVRHGHELRGSGKTGWLARQPFRGSRSFHSNELLSPFSDSRLANLAAKFLKAWRKSEAGDVDDLIAFHNSSLAKSWAYQTTVPKEEALRARGEDYAEFSVPAGGLVLTMGVDVQHNRLALTIWAWGRGEEMWLVFWGELHGAPGAPGDPVWAELDRYLLRGYRHATGVDLHIRATSVDTSDGQTSDAAYAWVRKHRRHKRAVFAAKGAADKHSNREIFAPPAAKSIDHRSPTKAEKYGLRSYMVGTQKAKDLLLGHSAGAGRINLCESAEKTGSGPARMHWYKTARSDFVVQLALSEVKVPARGSRNLMWQAKVGARNEALDCTVFSLHAARSMNLHRFTEAMWAEVERRVRQLDLVDSAQAATADEAVQTSAPETAGEIRSGEASPEAGREPASVSAGPVQRQRRRGHRVRRPGGD